MLLAVCSLLYVIACSTFLVLVSLTMKFTSTKLCVLAQLMFLALVRATGTIHHSADDNFDSLSSLLSGDAEIYLPGSEGFVNGTASLVAKKPQLDALVKVATEQDVRNTVA